MTEETVKGQVQKMNELIKHTVIEMEQKEEKDHNFSFFKEADQKQESVKAKHLKRRIKPYTIKELQEKKSKRKVLAEKNTALKEAVKKHCRSRPETTEKELWERLDTLNNKFKVIKDLKKKNRSKKNLIV